ncbi:hypothetical protein GCM10022254_22250 [Actinomadura meridiana]|uniref:Rv2525c-like glycoside hydrolase-like domain-containing protein n=1 Tax=Actinomadura meridiana TaxID=559626 RepID=A0ABP8BXG0_9ACTN
MAKVIFAAHDHAGPVGGDVMRRAVLPSSAVLCGVALIGGAALVAGPSFGAEPPPVPAASDDPADARVVEYRGLRVRVPAGWEVHDLDRDPSRCIRYDRHAVYLGRPGPQPDCPARLVGRTEAVHLQPAAEDGRAARTTVPASRLATLKIPASTDHEARLTLPDAGVAVTGVYGTDPALLQRVLRDAEPNPDWKPGPDTQAPPEPNARRGGPGPVDTVLSPLLDEPWARGKGFDTCTAPSLAAMRAWRPSFKVTNIYIGGAARGCAQPNLTGEWVDEVREMGYRITPTYVGLQAPCGSRPQRFTAKNAASQGAKSAVDAARKAEVLGIPEGAPIYYDMEAYKSKKRGCKAAVLRFVDNWVQKLEELGYEPCLYSSASSGIRDVGRADGISKPTAIWFAHWNGKADVYGDSLVPDDWWRPHRRIKQYRGGHKEKHGGVTLNIDRNMVDGRVY